MLRTTHLLGLFLLASLTFTSCSDDFLDTESLEEVDTNRQSHDYLLNIIGVPHEKSEDFSSDSEGRRIFVGLGEAASNGNGNGNGNKPGSTEGVGVVTKILLEEGDYAVLDANGTDGEAKFRLPNPGTGYRITARALGKPGGAATITTCGTDIQDEVSTDYCGSEGITFEAKRGGGKKEHIQDVTTELTTFDVTVSACDNLALYECLSGTTVDTTADDYNCEDFVYEGTISLFNECFEEYFWSYNNKGLKLLQLRFYSEN